MTITYLASEWPPNFEKWPVKSCYAQTFVLAFQILISDFVRLYWLQGLTALCETGEGERAYFIAGVISVNYMLCMPYWGLKSL